MNLPSRRSLLRRLRSYRRPVLLVLAFVFILDAFVQLRARPAASPPPLLAPQPLRRVAGAVDEHENNGTSVFIVSVHRNTEPVLRSAWNDAVVRLADNLGPANVYFSAVESGSQDDTKAALMELEARLADAGVSTSIRLGATVWEQLDELETRPETREPGWIWNAEDGHFDMRRIPYLAKVRNEAMEPLAELAEAGRRFDKVLWLNDVVFDTEDFLALLHTRGGRYAAACSMDFKHYPYYYDTFALRDEHGQKTVSTFWPWFDTASTARRAAMLGQPARVFSCWNGMVLFDAAPFYADPPLRFRGVDDSLADLHLEASECCLVHADNALYAADEDRGVWLNPNVRVAYDVRVYRKVKAGGGVFPGPLATVVGAWVRRLSHFKTGVQLGLERRTVQARLDRWEAETPAGEPRRMEVGEPCLINEMQIMWQNGWRHLR